MSNKASNLYVPDYQAWEQFYDKRAKQQNVGVGFETERGALNHQQQEIVVNTDRSNTCSEAQNHPKFISVVSPTEQTVQQAESVMKKAGRTVKKKVSKKTKNKSRPKKTTTQKRPLGKKKTTFSYRTLSDIFSKRK